MTTAPTYSCQEYVSPSITSPMTSHNTPTGQIQNYKKSLSIPSLLMLYKLFQNAAVNTDEIYSIHNVHDIPKRHI